jgi:hypothetical protein
MNRALGEHQTPGCGRPLVRLQVVVAPRQDFFLRAALDTMRGDTDGDSFTKRLARPASLSLRETSTKLKVLKQYRTRPMSKCKKSQALAKLSIA